MVILNVISKSLERKRVIFATNLITLLLITTIIGCAPSDILITRDRPFDVSKVSSIAFLPFSGKVTNCAHEANKALEIALLDYFKSRNIKVVQVSAEWVRAMPDLVDATGVFNEKKALEIGRIFEVDSFISGSISECQYYNPNIGDGLLKLSVNIYDTKTGDLLAKIDGKKIAASYESGTVAEMTSEITNAMLAAPAPYLKYR